MPCLTYAWLDYRIRFPAAPQLDLSLGPDRRIHPGLRLDLFLARFP